MRLFKIVILLFASTSIFGQGVIPKPTEIQIHNGSLPLNSAYFSFDSTGYINQHLIDLFLKQMNSFDVTHGRNNKVSIKLIKTEEFSNKDRYKILINKTGIVVGGSESGIFHGLQTLRQLVFQCNGELQCQTIIDSPAFKWRGMHLDVSRHFFSVDFIKKYIDMLALHKMNTFHWHLTDDQGWRIEIKKYPKLTQIGSQRKETIIDKNFNPYKGDGKPYGGFYTQEDIKEVVAYAKERYITVVPEIEMPGHAVAALSAYPQFSCRQQPLETLTKWGISDDIYCSKDETFQFIFDILDEVLELFPSQYIHIGGDEAPKTRWKKCEHCKANIKKHKLKDEHELQSYFISRVDSFLTSKGRKTIGWDEILEGGLAENAAVMSWRGEKGGIAAASQKHNVVMSPGSHCYFDHYQGDKKSEPLAIGGYTPLKKVYSYNPIPAELDKEYVSYVLGAQGNVWTEYMETPGHVLYMALPRLCALSEVLWSGSKKSSYKEFTDRLIPHFDLLDTLGFNYSKALFNIRAHSFVKEEAMFVRLSSDFPEFEIRYTTNGEKPTATSRLNKSPILINRNTELKARLFKNGVAKGNLFSQKYEYHLAVGKKITLTHQPSERYNTGGAQALINGVIGSLPWSGNEWLAWRGKPMEAEIDLGQPIQLSNVRMSFLEAPESWIHRPINVLLFGSTNGKNYKPIKPKQNKQWPTDGMVYLNIDGMYRYIKVKAIPLDVIPEGNPGSGQESWLFCSEIIIE